MALPGRTFDGTVLVGTDSWAIDMTNAVNSMSVTNEVNNTRQPVMGRRAEDAINQSTTHTVDLSAVYVGPETEMLRARQGVREYPWVCAFDEAVGMSTVINALLTGVPENAPTSEAIVTAISFPQAEWAYGSYAIGSVTKFRLVSGTASAPVGNIAAGKHAFLIVNEFNGDALDVTVSGATAVNVGSVGIHYLGEYATASATSTVSATGSDLTSDDVVAGYVLIVDRGVE